MCGIFGCVGPIPIRKRRALISALAVFNESRGKYSTGIAILYRDGGTGLIKRALPARQFIQLDEFNLCMNKESSDLVTVIGHCRLPTIGKVTGSNAHPFRVGDTIGTHNGIVSNINTVRRFCETRGATRYDVDSRYLIWLLDRTGEVNPADGALTLAWFSRKEPSAKNPALNIARHNRPLSYGFTRSGAMIYSSEQEHLETAAAIAGIQLYNVRELPNYSAMSVFLCEQNGTYTKAIENFYERSSR